jgi:RND superfamily putative drug exporter
VFAWWGGAVCRFRWPVLLGAVAFTIFAGIWGTGVFDALAGAGFNQPNSESERTAQRIESELGWRGPSIVALYSSKTLTVDDRAFRDPVEHATSRVKKHAEVVEVASYYGTKAPNLVSKDRHATYVAIRVTEEADFDDFLQIRDNLKASGLVMQLGGPWAVDMDVGGRAKQDIAKAEMISMPVLLVLMALVFGSLVAATTPLLVGSLAIIGAFTVVRLVTYVTDVSSFSINIITILGLGLAIDYALFVVSRFREELDAGRPTPEAVTRTMATAGRTVLVSGVTVALALAGLLIFPQMFLRSMGIGGIAAVVVAVLVSLTVLPALLAVLGHRIDALRLPWAKRRAARETDQGFWGRIARSVMRRPALYATATVILLLLLAVPFTRVQFGGMDERVLPKDTESRLVSERIRDDFPRGEVDPITVLVSGASAEQAADFAKKIKTLSAVRDATPTAHKGRSTVITVSYDGASTSVSARGVVERIRDLAEPRGAEVLVGGPTAELVDLLDGLRERLPWMLLFVAGVTFVLLFLAFGSVVLPLKAITMNVLSLGASFGAVVWVFQDGHLSGVLGFTPMGTLEATQPILMLALLFGLSMDYEVFLLSRIREQWDLLGDNTAAVASGVQRTGRIITAAALLLAVVVAAFATSGISFIKMIGLGMLVAITVDATLVRLILVPATMRLMGAYNWWAPGFLRAVYARYGIRESDEPSVPAPRTRTSAGLPGWLRELPIGSRATAPLTVALAGLFLMAISSVATFMIMTLAYRSAPVAAFRPAPGLEQRVRPDGPVSRPTRPPEPPPSPRFRTKPAPLVSGGGGPRDGREAPGVGSHLPTMPGVPGN